MLQSRSVLNVAKNLAATNLTSLRDIKERLNTTIVLNLLHSQLSSVSERQNHSRLSYKKPRRHLRLSYLLAKSKASKLSDEQKFNKKLRDKSQDEKRTNTTIDGTSEKLDQDETTTMRSLHTIAEKYAPETQSAMENTAMDQTTS
jgi:hypothetical protein